MQVRLAHGRGAIPLSCARKSTRSNSATSISPATWQDWRDKGALLVIVTASPSLVVRPFAERLQADVLIGTEFAFDGADRVTGAFSTANCRGPEKVARLEARFGQGVRLAAAYGDTSGDREMLAIAETAGYRVFTGVPAL